MLLESGRVSGIGSFDTVMNTPHSPFAAMMLEFATHPESLDQAIDEVEPPVKKPAVLSEPTEDEARENPSQAGKENTEEKMKSGNVGLSIYASYLRAGLSYFYLAFLVFVMIMGEGFLVASIYWLGLWSQQPTAVQEQQQSTNIYIFVGLVLSTISIALFRSIFFYLNSLRSGRLLFGNMLKSVFRAPVDFFHSNTHGRIMKYVFLFLSLNPS